jgi:hypothetical protein
MHGRDPRCLARGIVSGILQLSRAAAELVIHVDDIEQLCMTPAAGKSSRDRDAVGRVDLSQSSYG